MVKMALMMVVTKYVHRKRTFVHQSTKSEVFDGSKAWIDSIYDNWSNLLVCHAQPALEEKVLTI